MTDGETFLVIFAALYLSDCFAWSGRNTLAFVEALPGQWAARRPGELLGNDRGGVVSLWPLPPLGTVFLAKGWLLSVSEAGVATVTPESPNPGWRVPQPDRFFAWGAVDTVSVDGNWILINESKFCKAASSVEALTWGRRILRWRRLPSRERTRRIAALLRASFNGKRIERLVGLHDEALRFLRIQANLLFVLCFAAVPLGYWYWRATLPFFLLLLAGLLLMIQITAESFRLHRKLYRSAAAERWQHVFLQLFVPQFAMRALDPLSKNLLWRFHPLAVASVLLNRKRFERMAGAWYRDLQRPLAYHIGSATAIETAEAYRNSLLLPAVEWFLESQEVVATALTEQPSERDELSLAYCPRCHAQFIVEEAACRACGGMRTFIFSKQ